MSDIESDIDLAFPLMGYFVRLICEGRSRGVGSRGWYMRAWFFLPCVQLLLFLFFFPCEQFPWAFFACVYIYLPCYIIVYFLLVVFALVVCTARAATKDWRQKLQSSRLNSCNVATHWPASIALARGGGEEAYATRTSVAFLGISDALEIWSSCRADVSNSHPFLA